MLKASKRVVVSTDLLLAGLAVATRRNPRQ
jgi:hypothetical protein